MFITIMKNNELSNDSWVDELEGLTMFDKINMTKTNEGIGIKGRIRLRYLWDYIILITSAYEEVFKNLFIRDD